MDIAGTFILVICCKDKGVCSLLNGEVQKDDVDKVKFQNGEVHENEIEKVAVQKIMLKEVIQNHAQWKDKQIKSTEIMKEVNIETEMNSDKKSFELSNFLKHIGHCFQHTFDL
jgi:hypothetical protein